MNTDSEYVPEAGLRVGRDLHVFCSAEALPDSGVEPERFWTGLADLVAEFGPRNEKLLGVRATLQRTIDAWHHDHADQPHDGVAYRAFLEEIGYLLPEGPAFTIDTTNVDAEIRLISAPQLVVPVTNARYTLNAANARWGSLYDALYGTDALGDLPRSGPYDPERGGRVVEWVRSFLDDVVPLNQASHHSVTRYHVVDGGLAVALDNGTITTVADSSLFAGYSGDPHAPSSVVFEHHGLGIEIRIDREHSIGRDDPAGVSDVYLEAALTSIIDFEDSVATVDSADKTLAYRNWLGLMTGRLTEDISKAGVTFTRSLAADRHFTDPDGSAVERPGRALMLARNVGHLMTTPAVLDADGRPIPEGILDALVTVLCAKHDLVRTDGLRNSGNGSIYVVKPKMHGPDEVAFTVDLFTRVEQILSLAANTVKIGIMDEERRTTLNLVECIRAARSRVCFINTGFLDRTGDEIHTSMHAGPMVRKTDMKAQGWILAYEDWNVDVGLTCGFKGRAQIGKGMWATPDLMHDMLEQKIGHPRAGASCAWVPSPTAAILHATHYHYVNVAERQHQLGEQLAATGPRTSLDELLAIPLASDPAWTDEEIQAELDNNAQGILGYVVRWVDQGVGCSKVPDINDIGLMEDRATCRISSQHMANWLHHGVVTESQVMATMCRMAETVDRQNADDELYVPMTPDLNGPAFRAACDLVFSGAAQPSGYTEPILHARRLQHKSSSRI